MRKTPASGSLNICQIESVDTDNFRCDVSIPGSYSFAKNIPLNPSPIFGVMPTANTLAVIYDRPGLGKRIIGLLNEINDTTPQEQLIREDFAGLYPNLKEGECFIGRHGRAHFDNKGNIYISAESERAGLELSYDDHKAKLYAYDLDLYTNQKNVRIHTESTGVGVSKTWGDSLYIGVNVPLATPDIGVQVPIPPTPLGRMIIANTGAIDLELFPLTARTSNLSFGVQGEIQLGRGAYLMPKTVALSISKLDDVRLYNAYAGLSLVGDQKYSESTGVSPIDGWRVTPTVITPINQSGDTYSGVDVTQIPVKPLFGGVELYSLVGENSLKLSPQGDIMLHNGSASLNIFGQPAIAGNINFGNNKVELAMSSIGGFSVSSPPSQGSTYNLGINSSGMLSFIGKNVDLYAPSIRIGHQVGIGVTGLLSLEATAINLGLVPAGNVAFAQAILLLCQQLNKLNMVLKTHTHSISGTIIGGQCAVVSPFGILPGTVTGNVVGGFVDPLTKTGSLDSTGGASPSFNLALAGLIPPVPTLASLGSTTVTVQA